MTAGNLRARLSFQAREEVDDGYGNTVSGDFKEQFQDHAEMKALKGGEAVIASRLQGKQPFLISVRSHTNTRRITTDWRAVNARSGAVYAITTAVERPKGDYIDMTVIEGVAA